MSNVRHTGEIARMCPSAKIPLDTHWRALSDTARRAVFDDKISEGHCLYILGVMFDVKHLYH
jgi:hypothetical protein